VIATYKCNSLLQSVLISTPYFNFKMVWRYLANSYFRTRPRPAWWFRSSTCDEWVRNVFEKTKQLYSKLLDVVSSVSNRIRFSEWLDSRGFRRITGVLSSCLRMDTIGSEQKLLLGDSPWTLARWKYRIGFHASYLCFFGGRIRYGYIFSKPIAKEYTSSFPDEFVRYLMTKVDVVSSTLKPTSVWLLKLTVWEQ
jgi:hypothetical protein